MKKTGLIRIFIRLADKPGFDRLEITGQVKTQSPYKTIPARLTGTVFIN